MRTLLAAVVLAIVVPDRPDPAPREAKPEQQIVGDWLCIEATGKNVHTFLISPTETLWSLNGQAQPGNGLSAKIVIDGSKSPATIDFIAKQGGQKYTGIWKVEGDQLTLAWANGDLRPTAFAAPAQVTRFRRIK